jgi:hypothetical protein
LFHILKKEYDFNHHDEITSNDATIAINSLETLIDRDHSKYPLGSSIRERALLRVEDARSEIDSASNENKYALTRLHERALLAETALNMLVKTNIDARSQRPDLVNAPEEISRLLREYNNNKEVIRTAELLGAYEPVASERFFSSSSMVPNDPASRYAITVATSADSCVNCGQFIGIPQHECPLRESINNARSVAEMPSNSVSDSALRPVRPTPRAVAEDFDIRLEEVEVSIDDFQDLYDEAKSLIASESDPLAVQSESPGQVTSGLAHPQTGRSLGIELEIDFPHEEDYPFFENRNLLAHRLYQSGVTISPHVERWHHVGVDRPGGEYQVSPQNWICEFDRSVDPYEGERGLEIKSQVVFDDPAMWRNLDTILSTARQLGAEPTQRTGLHVNLGAEDFSTNNPNRHNRLLKLGAYFDDTLVRLAHNPASSYHHRGRAYCGYADVPPDGFSSVAEARARSNHYQAFNLGHMPAEGGRMQPYSRIEVRIWDGATKLGRVQSAINVSLAFAELSKYKLDIGSSTNIAGSTRENFGTAKLEAEQWTNATKPFRQFMGLYKKAGFSSDEALQKLTILFAESRWPKRW